MNWLTALFASWPLIVFVGMCISTRWIDRW